MQSSSAGLFADKNRCGMLEEDRFVLCDEGPEVEDIRLFILEFEECEWSRWELLGRVNRIAEAGVWVKEGNGDTHLSLLYTGEKTGCEYIGK